MKPNRNGFVDKLAVIAICLAMLVAGCGGSSRGDASAGPNPGGGFYTPRWRDATKTSVHLTCTRNVRERLHERKILEN
jgi:hypothetical protein